MHIGGNRGQPAHKQGLKADRRSVAAILLNAQGIFQSDLDGIRSLIPAFLDCILKMERIEVSRKEDSDEKADKVRYAAIRIIGSISSVCSATSKMVIEQQEVDRLAQSDFLYRLVC